MSINPQSSYGVLRDQGDGCDQYDYRPKNQFMTTPDPIADNHIRSTIGFKYWQSVNQTNPADVNAISPLVNYNGCTEPYDNCGEIRTFDTIGSYKQKEQVLIDSLNNSQDTELYYTELLHHYLSNDSIDAAFRMLDTVSDTLSGYILFSTDLFRKQIDTLRTALDLLPDADSNTTVFQDFYNIYLDLAAGVIKLDSFPVADSLQVTLGAAKSTTFSSINRGWLSYHLDNDYDTEAEEWPLMGKKGVSPEIPETNKEKEIQIYPNPSPGTFRVTGFDFHQMYYLTIYTTSGKMLFEKELTEREEMELTLSGLSNGIYFINITNQTGSLNFNQSIVLMR